MLQPLPNRALPLDHDAFLAAEPPTGRVIVIAPTRAACETIEIALGLHLETYLEKTHGPKVRELARGGLGFGIIAGTGTGKTLAVRPIAEEILRAPLKIGVVNREREATPDLPNFNVIIVTTGVARRWFQDGDILARDTLVVDEIHQTSAELELCLALGKRVGCRFIWLSATVDPQFYRAYLNSADVLEVFSFDPNKAADVRVVNREPIDFLDERFLKQIAREKRGVGVFLPTRAGVENAASGVKRAFPALQAAHYHGGEPVSVIRPFLEDEGAKKPYLLAMTAAGQSALNVRGLDTVVIEDARFANVIINGRNVLARLALGNNEILQMAGRVHGRVAGGRVFILSNRDINFSQLRPTAPEFQLAGDCERVALTCADLNVRADELELPVVLDKTAYRRAFSNLCNRGLINEKGRLTTYGKAVEALPVDRAWAELIVNADADLVPFLAIMSSIESLHRLTREESDIDGLIVPGSDHLTTYNVFADAFQNAGFLGQIHGLPRHLFEPKALEEWSKQRGVLTKSLEDAALAAASILRGVGLALPLKMPLCDEKIRRRFVDLLAKWMPFDLAIDEQTADGQNARVSNSSVCGPNGAVAGNLRYFSDRFGAARAAIEGTQIPFEILRRYAKTTGGELVFQARRKPSPLVWQRQIEYFGFVLDSHDESLEIFPPELVKNAREVLAQALARGEARHLAVHANHEAIETIREFYRRSKAQTPRLGESELAAHYLAQLNAQNVHSMTDFRAAKFGVKIEDFVTPALQKTLRNLPSSFKIQGRDIEIAYEIEENGLLGVARLKLPEKLARTLKNEGLPKFDRPFRFAVSRGSRGTLRADNLKELQRELEGAWTPNDVENPVSVGRKVAKNVGKPNPRRASAKAGRRNKKR